MKRLFVLLFLLVSLVGSLSAQEPVSCEALVDRAIGKPPPGWRLVFRAGAQTSETLESRALFFSGLFFELPLVDPQALARIKRWREQRERLLAAIARVRDLSRRLAFKRDVARYHKKRIDYALEDNEAFLRAKEEALRLEEELHQAEALLRAYGIELKEALSCRW